ncbi:MAG: NADH-quinone oxidoreductase subunit D [Nitrospinaceae bacterium]|jgi:NADH-quinone oxidoreductase subunit D|nr:NADH-quinone oxidoreductase subunit D [Nitrospinaceae bacterium]MBT3434829.1 NADH-quinone oxidoreductase subunit D [Nitrospinaceae bacterium]MBT3820231.1 NADH-quinone oxidoreductase subunit D [Nitrospinaceae bacterium]MBT4094946.1 NADH-quinone oxidoreductase subunit D [Nitrospinaceae bacterium]MBT4429322.1 NADH-quinone oxidoreductase subunit D [Nitrospinaceae bacterium]
MSTEVERADWQDDDLLGPIRTETMTLNMGPQHPSTHGVLRMVLDLEGETVKGCRPVIGYLHTGIEKSMEERTYNKALPMTDRMDYLAPMSNNLGYVLAVEKLLGMEIPPRCQYLRVLLAEMTRIQSHLVWLGTHALDLGAMTVFLYCFREREAIIKIFEKVAGVRMMTSYFRVGGVSREPYPEFYDDCRKFFDDFPSKVDDYEELLTDNPIFRGRTRGVGAISADKAIALGVTGPLLRACGIDYDIRKKEPYLVYDKMNFNVPLGESGDIYDRYLVRMAELRESQNIAVQALEGMPEGSLMADDPKVVPPPKEQLGHDMEALIHHFKIFTEGYQVPAGEVYQAIESPRGELGYYIISDGSPSPYKVKVRAPSFSNLFSMAEMVKGGMFGDVVAALGSVDIVLGEIDR